MNVSELIERLELKLLTKKEYKERSVDGCYIGDLLSWVMGRAGSGDVWITIMNNVNIVAVASLTECACILLAEGVKVEQEIIDRADSQDIIIVSSKKTSYELAAAVNKLICL